jgi:hypothetical protein
MWFPNRISLGVLILLAAGFSLLQAAAQEKNADQRFGYLSVTTVQAASKPQDPGSFASGVVVRFYDEETHRDSLVLTDEHGTALLPLHEGFYCAAAYGTDGLQLQLDSHNKEKASRCIHVAANQTAEFSLTLAHGVKYSNTVPALGVR